MGHITGYKITKTEVAPELKEFLMVTQGPSKAMEIIDDLEKKLQASYDANVEYAIKTKNWEVL